MPSKFRNVKVVHGGRKFDSKKERDHYCTLQMLEKSGKITNLECQVSYRLDVNGFHICRYVADFRYFCVERKCVVVEDVKSPATARLPVFIMKKKMMRAIHGITVDLI